MAVFAPGCLRKYCSQRSSKRTGLRRRRRWKTGRAEFRNMQGSITAWLAFRSEADRSRKVNKHECLPTGIQHGARNLGDGPPILAGNSEVYANVKAARKQDAQDNPPAVYMREQRGGKTPTITEYIRDRKIARNRPSSAAVRTPGSLSIVVNQKYEEPRSLRRVYLWRSRGLPLRSSR
jgi:hypothetical protein